MAIIRFIIKENNEEEKALPENEVYKIVKLSSEKGEKETEVFQKDVSVPQSVFNLGLRLYSVVNKKTDQPVATIVKGPKFGKEGKKEQMVSKDKKKTMDEGIYDIFLASNIDRHAFLLIGEFIEGLYFFRVDLRGRQIYHPTMAIQHSQFGQFIEGIVSSFIGKATSPALWSGKRYKYSGTIRDPNETIEASDFDEGERWG